EAPERRIADLAMLSAAERQQLLVEWNATAAEGPRTPVHRLVAEHAERRPGNLAVDAPDDSLTYATLNDRAGQLARHLQRLGVAPGSLVAVVASRSAALVTGPLAVLKAGGAYVPLDPSYPAERLAWMIEDLAASGALPAVLVEERLRGLLPRDLAARGVRLVSLGAEPPPEPEEVPYRFEPVHPAGLAYVIYTSGS